MIIDQTEGDEESSLLSMDAIRRFKSILDEEDESDFEVVSSTKQRLDLLLATTSEEDDDFLVISTPSRLGFDTHHHHHQQQQQQINFREIKSLCRTDIGLAILTCVLFGILTLLLHSHFIWRKKKQETLIQRKYNTDSKTVKTGPSLTSVTSEVVTRQVEQETSAPSDTTITLETVSGIPMRRREVLGELNGSTVPILTQEEAIARLKAGENGTNTLTSEVGTDGNLRTTMHNVIVKPSVGQTTNDAITQGVLVQSKNDDNRMKIQLATKIAKDIKLVEQVLLEQGLDKSLAQHLAVGLQTSETMLESQRQLEIQRMLVDAHQRSLDRQLSQRQHEEAIQAAKYDPNWSEKLEQKRDLCWKAATRILLEVTVAYHLTKLVKPVLELYRTETNLSFQELTRLVIYSLCDCELSKTEVSSRSAPTYFLIGYQVVDIFQFFGLDSIMMLDSGICYGYCLVSFTCIMLATVVLHQGLRVVSAPSILHHAVNIATITLCYGGTHLLQNPSSWFVAVSDAKFLAIGALLLWLFALVQWNYSKSRKSVLQAKNSPSKFQEALSSSMEQMQTLQFQLCIFQYAMVAIYCSVLFVDSSGNGEAI